MTTTENTITVFDSETEANETDTWPQLVYRTDLSPREWILHHGDGEVWHSGIRGEESAAAALTAAQGFLSTATATVTNERDVRRNIIRAATGVEPFDLGNALGAAFDSLDATAGEDGYERIAAVTEAVDRYRRAEALVDPHLAYVHARDGYASIGWYGENITDDGLRIEVSSAISVGRPLEGDDNELTLAIGDDLFLSLTEVRQLIDALSRAELVMSHVGPDHA